MSTAQDLPLPYGEPLATAPTLRLVPVAPLDFDEAVRRVQPRLQRYAARRLDDLHEAEELVQEALLRAYSHRAQLLTEDDLAAWSTVVTGRLVIDRLRVRGRSTSMAEVPETARVGRDTADVVVARDEARLALDALDAMPTRQAALLWAREVEGNSYVELCSRFSMTEPAVRSVLTRARKALRKEYAARGGSLPIGGLAILAPWVGGLGWAERLRRVAAKVSAPAALSAASISALSGLVLAPFGATPLHPTYRPSDAVVTHGLVRAVPSTPSLTRSDLDTRTRLTKPRPARQSHSLTGLVQHARGTTPCINDRDADGSHPTVSVPVSVWGGSTSCDGFQHDGASTVYVPIALPDNPTGIRNISVRSTLINCADVPQSVLLTCTSGSTQQGATQ